jgi:acyl-CoA thioesterase
MTGLGDLLAALDLESVDETEGRFRAGNVAHGPGVVFGGQLLAQSLVAAARTIPGKEVLSLHTVFARGASQDQPLDVVVEPIHSGRAFASVAVTIGQDERTCTRSLVLLHDPSPDLIRHAEHAPDVASANDVTLRPAANMPWELRIVDDVDLSDPDAHGPPELRVWVRFSGAADVGDPAISQALLAYASDGFLIGTAMRPHPGVGQSMAHVSISTTVLTQTLSFHEHFHAGDWLLLDQRSTYAGRGRSRGRAEVFTADGRLVASFGQDNMIRDFPDGQAPSAGERAKH